MEDYLERFICKWKRTEKKRKKKFKNKMSITDKMEDSETELLRTIGHLLDDILCILGEIPRQLRIFHMKNYICRVCKCRREEITSTLYSSVCIKGKKRFYVGDLVYKANIRDELLTQIELIWGDAHLEAVHDFRILEGLKCVLGDVYLTEGENKEYLNNLKVVAGDIHIRNEGEDYSFLKNLQYVGGRIYR